MGIVTAAIIGASVAVAGSAVGAISAHQGKQRAKGQMMTAQRELEELELNRQDVINPYEGVTNLSDMVSDVSNMASNPFANLSVSTAAAEMQVEEADIALANTLDTLAMSGMGGGGGKSYKENEKGTTPVVYINKGGKSDGWIVLTVTYGCSTVSYTHLTLPTNREV